MLNTFPHCKVESISSSLNLHRLWKCLTSRIHWNWYGARFQAQTLTDWRLPLPVSRNTSLWNPEPTMQGFQISWGCHPWGSPKLAMWKSHGKRERENGRAGSGVGTGLVSLWLLQPRTVPREDVFKQVQSHVTDDFNYMRDPKHEFPHGAHPFPNLQETVINWSSKQLNLRMTFM